MFQMIRLQLHLRLDTAMLIARGHGGGALNQRTVRDSGGHLLLPATTLKGRLRYHGQQFAHIMGDGSAAAVTLLFGDATQQGALFFQDARLLPMFGEQAGLPFSEERTGILVSRRTGSVVDQHLRFYEAVPAGLIFATTIEGRLPANGPGTDALCHLLGAIRLLRQLGANKSRGMGLVTPMLHELHINKAGKHQTYDAAQIDLWLERAVTGRLKEAAQ